MKRRLRATVLPVLLLAVTGYFVVNAIDGSRGMTAQRHGLAVLAQDGTTLTAVLATRDRWQARVDALRHHAIAKDMLNAQARAVLDLAEPDDLSLPLPRSPAAQGGAAPETATPRAAAP